MGMGIEAGSKAVLITTDLDDEDSAGDFWVEGPDNPLYLDGYSQGIYKFEASPCCSKRRSPAIFSHGWQS